MILRIAADFNSKDETGRVDLGVNVSHLDLDRLHEQIRPGLSVILYFDGVEVDAILEYDRAQERWYGYVPDWTNYRDILPQ